MSPKAVVAVLALAVACVSGRPYDGEEVFDCSRRADGYYPDATDSKAFFSCSEGGLVARVVCNDGFEFDGKETCVPVASERMDADRMEDEAKAELEKEEVKEELEKEEVKEELEKEDVKEELENELEKFEIPQNMPQIFPPCDDDDDDDDDDEDEENDKPEGGRQETRSKKIYNIEITKNIFPRSILIVGKMNREQKNK